MSETRRNVNSNRAFLLNFIRYCGIDFDYARTAEPNRQSSAEAMVLIKAALRSTGLGIDDMFNGYLVVDRLIADRQKDLKKR